MKTVIKHLDLFSGIGGFSLAADRVWQERGVQHVFCEIDPFCQEVLKKHWPNSLIHGNIKELICLLQTQNDKQNGGRKIPLKYENTGEITTTETTPNFLTNQGKGQKSAEEKNERIASLRMEQNVHVAEKRQKSSSLLTTKKTMATKNESYTESPELTKERESKDTQQNINSSVSTVIVQKESTENVHTKTNKPFLLTGGFPCQPFSQAGRRKGTSDDRFLWPHMFSVIQLVHPEWIIAENVGGFVNIENGLVLEQVHADMEGEGYSVQAFIIPACAVNAPHRRDRVWIVAHTKGTGDRGRPEKVCKANGGQKRKLHSKSFGADITASNSPFFNEERGKRKGDGRGRPEGKNRDTDWDENWLEVATRLCRVDDGLPKRLDRNPRLKALGNAIVPQVAEEIMRAIKTT